MKPLITAAEGEEYSVAPSRGRGLKQWSHDNNYRLELLQEALGPAMKALGVSFRFEDNHPSWTEAVEGLASFMSR